MVDRQICLVCARRTQSSFRHVDTGAGRYMNLRRMIEPAPFVRACIGLGRPIVYAYCFKIWFLLFSIRYLAL